MRSYEENRVRDSIYKLISDAYSMLDDYKHDWNDTSEQRDADWNRHRERVVKRVNEYLRIIKKLDTIQDR